MFETFLNPPREYTLIPLWFLNDDLSEEELRRQIDDFAVHGVYGFVIHPKMGLPEAIFFMSEAYLHFVKVCVDYAASKGLIVYLYDEGMYPSGSCAGQVVAAEPRHVARCLERRRPDDLVGEDEYLVAGSAQWAYVHCGSKGTIRGVHFGMDDGEPGAPSAGDILNPEAAASFLRLVLDRYHEALRNHFGKTVRGIFTDEPDLLGRGARKDVRPWTRGFETFLDDYLGCDFRPHLSALWDSTEPEAERFRADFDRAVDARLEQAYYIPYRARCKQYGIALTGHPAGSADMAMLKHFDIPGQDVVWRYVEPFKPSALEGVHSTMAKCTSSVQRHYGRARNANECFGVYGWNLTYEEMRWLTNWLLVRGVNLLFPHGFCYSIRGPRRDERPPDVGPHNVWWDGYRTYADYCRRLCWLLSGGKHICHIAILGGGRIVPWRAARALFEAQRDFNYLDSDTLLRESCITPGCIAIRDMRYEALIIDGAGFVTSEVLRALRPLINAGRVIAYGEPVPSVPHLATEPAALLSVLKALVPRDVSVSPGAPDLRYIHMRHEEADFYLFSNEGAEPIDVAVQVSAAGECCWLDPESGQALRDILPERLTLPSVATRVLCCWAR